MNRPCLCAGSYVCTQHFVPQARRRMADNKLTALARDFDITDAQWCQLMYLHVVDDLDLLLFEGETS